MTAITIVDAAGLHGTAPAAALWGEAVEITFEDGRTAVVPVSLIEADDADAYRLPFALDDYWRSSEESDEIVLPIIEEEVAVSKRRIATGKVRVTRERVAEERYLEVPLHAAEVEVRRLSCNQPVDSPPPVRQEGDTTIIPVTKEILVIEKRLVVVEEVHVTRRESVTLEKKHVVLQHDKVKVEREELA